MIEAYKSFWTNYFNFEGRTTRSGYWYVFLMNIIIGFVIGFLSGLLGSGISSLLMGLYSLYSLAILIPGIAVFVRRLHDINKSG